MKSLKEFALEKGKEMARELRNECDGTYVGAEENEDFEFEGKKYNIEVCAFWEKCFHFEYYIKGIGFDFSESGRIAF